MTSSRPNNLQSTLHSVAETAARLCEADDTVILRAEDDHFCVASHYGSLPALEIGQRFPIQSNWLSGLALKERSVVDVHDMMLESRVDFDHPTPAIGAYRSTLTVPMLRDDDAFGVIAIRRREVQPFTVKERELLQSLAERSATEIEMSRLRIELGDKDKALTGAVEQLTEALGQQTATSEILRVISQSQRDVQPVFQAIAANARRLCGGTSAWVVAFDDELMRVVAADSTSPTALAALRQLYPLEPSHGSVTGRAIMTRAMVHIPDFRTDLDYSLAGLTDT